jgi:opacity protein-like surface antigen
MTIFKPLAAALSAVAIAAPVAAALADQPTAPAAPAGPLAAKLAGHRTVSGIFHAAAHRRHLDERRRRAARARRLRAAYRVPAALRGKLASIAACESHGDPHAIGGGGAFRGKYQFDYGTWASVGGQGDPAAASELEQDHRAALLLRRAGTSPWPICG